MVALTVESHEQLQSLTKHPGWQELRRVMEERQEFHAKRLARRVMSLAGVDPGELTRQQGFWAGVFAVLDTPTAVEKKLETMLRRAQQTEGDT